MINMRICITDIRSIRLDTTFELTPIKLISEGIESVVETGRYFRKLEIGKLFDVDQVVVSVITDILASSSLGCKVVHIEIMHYFDELRAKSVIDQAISQGVDSNLISSYYFVK